MKYFLPTAAALAFTLNAFSQQPTMLTLRSALEQARLNYPALRAKESEISAQQKKLNVAKTEYLPALLVGGQINYATANSVTGAYISNEGLSTSIAGGIRDHAIYTGVFGSFGTLEVDWRIFNFGKIAANVDVSRSAVVVSQADYENEVFQHQVKVADAYLLALVMQKISIAQQRNLVRAQQLLDVIRAGARSGLKAGADSSFALAEVARAKIQLLESKKNERTALIRLTELVGEKGEIPRMDTAAFFTGMPHNFATDGDDLKNIPGLKLAGAQVGLHEARSIAIRRSYAPSLLFTGSGFGRGSGISNKDDSYSQRFSAGVPFQTYNYYAGISLRLNILSYSRIHNEYKSEQFETERAQHEFDAAELAVLKQQEQAEMQFEIAQQQAAEVPVQYASAAASFAQSGARYRSGLSTIAEFAQSFYLLNQAEVDRSISVNNVWRAFLTKAAAAGDLSFLTTQIN